MLSTYGRASRLDCSERTHQEQKRTTDHRQFCDVPPDWILHILGVPPDENPDDNLIGKQQMSSTCLLGVACTGEIAIGDCKEHLIQNDAIFYGTPAKKTLTHIACLLENSVRRDIGHER